MDIKEMNMNADSLSKKYRLAVKEGLFDGSFKEFAELYNQKIDVSSSDSFEDSGSGDSTITPLATNEHAPVDLTTKKGKILGLTPTALIVVASIGVLLLGTGIVLFVQSGKKEA